MEDKTVSISDSSLATSQQYYCFSQGKILANYTEGAD